MREKSKKARRAKTGHAERGEAPAIHLLCVGAPVRVCVYIMCVYIHVGSDFARRIIPCAGEFDRAVLRCYFVVVRLRIYARFEVRLCFFTGRGEGARGDRLMFVYGRVQCGRRCTYGYGSLRGWLWLVEL